MVTVMITVIVSSLDHFIELARVPALHICYLVNHCDGDE
jgi:hypothetical protein